MDSTNRLRLDILAGFGVIAVILWAIIALLIFHAQRQTVESAVGSTRNLARTVAEYQDSAFRAIDLSLRLLRDQWQRDPASFDAEVAKHEEHLRKESVIQVAIVDAAGWTRYSRLPQAKPLNFEDREYFQLQKKRGTDELHISEPVMGRITKQWAIQVTRPLFDAQKRFAGIIVVAVPPPALELILQDINLGREGIITLARDDGTILARSGGLDRAGRATLAGWPGLNGDSPPSGDFRAPGRVDAVERFIAYRRLRNYPLAVFVGQGVDQVLAPYYRQRNLLLGGGALATVLLMMIALLLVARARERARFVEEREHLMLELHDSSIQSIYAIGLTLEGARRTLEKDPARAESAIAEAGANLNLVIQDLRSFITAERRSAYSEQEFVAEIERMLPPPGEHSTRFTIDIDRAIIPTLAPQQATHLLRIAREAISNIVRHAAARGARLSLHRRGERVCLEISDDGVGIAPQAEARLGMGLHHIQARARRLRGRATVEATPSHGTRIMVEFPHRG